ncbi:histidine phosphatase family protein [Salinimonas marina]|uniref:Histidine phosphatase family protein n=1 Tax=Salinimonas marina TaxID=2785918 RepID=A0A7S9HD50_9ALTE|nr:histidine phosphatase family protein [Salinimonas marina]QPG05840.1 histidine phosphatase family protein [Salinimonas marina]
MQQKKEILLIRHGRPASEHNGRVSSAGFSRWVRNYNRAPLHDQSWPWCQRDLSQYYIMTSSLRRAKLSAARYSERPVKEHHRLLDEMQIPRYRLPLTLKAWSWVYLNRLLWCLGRPGPFESFAQARERIRQAADMLDARAASESKICIFAHALTNRFLVRYLQRKGWQVTEKDHRYWGVIRLQK